MSGKMAPVLQGLRFLTVLLFAAATIAALWYVPQPVPLAPGLAALGVFGVALARLRHPGLALAAALAPFPAILWFGTSAYALMLAFAMLTIAAYGDAALKNENGLAAIAKPLPALAGTLLLAILWSLHVPVQLQSLLAIAAATIVALPALVLTAGFDEDAIVSGNRQRETDLRVFAIVARIAEPRWSLALTGAGTVLAVLGYFQIARQPPHFDWLAAPLAAAIVVVLTRDARGAVAALAVCALLLLFTGGVGGALLLFLLFALVLGRAVAAWRAAGESETMAWTRAIEEQGATILYAGLAAMIAAVTRGGPTAALHAGFGLIAALILFPAFSGALHAAVPRRRSVEELYRSNAS
jgi:hypothetical protein